MILWKENGVDELISEFERAVKSVTKSVKGKRKGGNEDHVIKVFTRLVLRGQIRSAVRWLTERCSGGTLSHSDVDTSSGKKVLDVLKSKHPDPAVVNSEAFLQCQQLPQLVSVDITGAHIGVVARKIQGSGGPGGTVASLWQDILLKFGKCSEQLRDGVADLSRCMANSLVDWKYLRALMANRLIGLDKCPGVRPIGIGEVLRRVLGKAMALVTGGDVEDVCGADQLCSGLKAGIEGAIHGMREMFMDLAGDGAGLLLVDAKNAFNSVNRMAALWNARVLWPRAARFVFNTYQGYSYLVLEGCPEFILSKEGVTQGDPLSMLLYSVAVLPLVHSLIDCDKWKQNWYADDSSCVGGLMSIKEWFDRLSNRGPAYGYYLQPAKSILVVHPSFVVEADRMFSDLGIRVVTGGRFLGGFIGDDKSVDDYVRKKIDGWVKCVEKMAGVAAHQPQAAYTAMIKSLQSEWSFLQRVVPECKKSFSVLRDKICEVFWPAVFEGPIDESEAKLFSLPARIGGLGLRDPVEMSDMVFASSREGSSHLVDAVKDLCSFSIESHLEKLAEARGSLRASSKDREARVLKDLLEVLDERKKRVIQRAVDWKTSGWLTVTPLISQHFDLSPVEFRDALAMRYDRPLVRLPPTCDGCGEVSSVQHALDCRKGGLVIRRHNEIRDSLGDLCNMAFGNAVREPVISEADGLGNASLVADLSVRGVWQPQVDSLLDVRVVDTDAPSHVKRSVKAVLATSEIEKKKKYSEAAELRRATFTPFVLSVDGAPGKEAESFLRNMAHVLAIRWDKNYAEVIGWMRASLSFSVIRATEWCLRGSRKKWRSRVWNDFEDGAGLWGMAG